MPVPKLIETKQTASVWLCEASVSEMPCHISSICFLFLSLSTVWALIALEQRAHSFQRTAWVQRALKRFLDFGKNLWRHWKAPYSTDPIRSDVIKWKEALLWDSKLRHSFHPKQPMDRSRLVGSVPSWSRSCRTKRSIHDSFCSSHLEQRMVLSFLVSNVSTDTTGHWTWDHVIQFLNHF